MCQFPQHTLWSLDGVYSLPGTTTDAICALHLNRFAHGKRTQDVLRYRCRPPSPSSHSEAGQASRSHSPPTRLAVWHSSTRIVVLVEETRRTQRIWPMTSPFQLCLWLPTQASSHLPYGGPAQSSSWSLGITAAQFGMAAATLPATLLRFCSSSGRDSLQRNPAPISSVVFKVR